MPFKKQVRNNFLALAVTILGMAGLRWIPLSARGTGLQGLAPQSQPAAQALCDARPDARWSTADVTPAKEGTAVGFSGRKGAPALYEAGLSRWPGWLGNRGWGTLTLGALLADPFPDPQVPVASPHLRVVDGQKYPQTGAGIQAAIDDAGPRSTILLPPGVYDLSQEITIKNEGVTVQGYGMGTRLRMTNPTANAFSVYAPLFMLRDMEIYSGVAKTGGAVINVQADQGVVSNIRLGGIYNGFEFVGHTAGGWTISDVRVPGGITCNRLIFLQSSQGTVGSIHVHNLMCSNRIVWRDACVVLDTGVDTFTVSDSEFGGPNVGIYCRNSLHGQAPRWIYINNSLMEGATIGTILKLDAVREFRYHGYLATAAVAVEVGPEAKNVDISHTVFVNMQHEAVRILRGSIDTAITEDTFEDTCGQAPGACDTIAVEPGASDFRIESNHFRSSQRNLPRYNINVSPGPSARYVIVNNRFGNFGVGGLFDGGTGVEKSVGANVK
jgi:hypothetical protein